MTKQSRTEELTFSRNGDVLKGCFARPEGEPPFPALVLIPDVRGLYDHYRDVARRFAGEGFATLSVDLYSREGPPDLPDMAAVFRCIRELPDRRVIADLDAAVTFLASRPDVRADAVGITGFCLGGQYALMAACTIDRLAACVSWYGMLRYAETNETKPASPLDMVPGLRCPYLGLFGAEDPIIPLADVKELESALERGKKTYAIEVYSGAGHAFFNDTRPDGYRPHVAAAAWARTIEFLSQHLAKK